MYLTTIVSAAAILLLSLALRSVDIFKFHAFGVDTYANLLYAKKLKDGQLNLYKVGKIVYPPLLPRLLYYLTDRISVRIQHIIPKLFDLLTSMTVFWFTLWFSGNEFTAILALLIFTLSPINIVNGFGIGTRSLGLFFLTVTMLASYAAMFSGQFNYVMFAVAITSGVLMMLSSRIAYKSYFALVGVTIGLIPLNLFFGVFAIVAVASLSLTLLITLGGFVDDFKGQIFLVNFFRKRKSKNKSFKKRIPRVFYYDLSWCIGLSAIASGVDVFLWTWLVAMVALSFLWIWGEGERHIALGTAPAAILAAMFAFQKPLILVPFLLVDVLVILRISLRVLKGRTLVSLDDRLLNLLNSIKEVKGDSLFLCLPPVYSAPLAYFANKKVLYGESSSREGVLFQTEVLDALNTAEGVDDLVAKFGVTHLFIDQKNLKITTNSNHWETLIQDEPFAVLRWKMAPEKSENQQLMGG
jgi:hypothetical protein